MSKYQFTLPSSSGSDFKSAEHLPLVVYFYPKDSTPGCTTEGLDFNARLEQFKALAIPLSVFRATASNRIRISAPNKASSLNY